MVSLDGNETGISRNSPGLERAKLLFLPIVGGVTLFFGFFYGINGAIVGFMYGVIGGLFVLHESLPAKKSTNIWLCETLKEKSPEERNRKR